MLFVGSFFKIGRFVSDVIESPRYYLITLYIFYRRLAVFFFTLALLLWFFR